MAAHAHLKNEFTEDEKYHNLMTWLNYTDMGFTAIQDYFTYYGPSQSNWCGKETYLQESMTKTTSLMVILVSAMLVDKMI